MFEKKRGKRFLASVMALVMLLSLAPVGALAADGETLTNEESPAVTQPANEAAPKPVVTDEQNTENTNEETTPPPSNEGDTGIPADNNDTSTAVSEMPVIMNPVDLLNQASDYTTELTWSKPSTTQDATFFYLKTPTSILGSNKAKDWGPALGNGEINTDGLEWKKSDVWGSNNGRVENATNVTNSNVNSWPSTHGEYDSEKDGYVLSKNSTHWQTIFNAYKDTIKEQLKIENLQKSDVEAIILTPFKVSRYNVTTGKTEKSYHVDCKVEVKCTQVVTATFNVKDVNDDDYMQVKAENYKSGSQVNFPSYSPEKAGYKFSGWYFDRNLSEKVEDNYTIDNENVDFYAKYTPKTYTVTFDSKEGSSVNPQNVNHGAKANKPSVPTREGYEFQGWYTGEDATASVYDFDTAVTQDITLYAHWTEEPATKPATTDVYVYFKMVDAAGNNIKDKSKINNDDLKKTAYNNDADKKTWATLGKIASAETLTDDTEYKGTNTTLVTVGNEAKDQLKNDDALHTDNKEIANTVLANIEWFQLKQWAGATGYVSDGSRWHLDGKITGYTVTYNNGTTEATDAVHDMPDADEMYYLGGSEYTVSDATPTREGYVFTGWKSNIENGTTIYNAKGKFEMPAKNVVLTAQWEKIYTVTFNAGDNGKLDQSQDTVTKTGTSGTPLAAPATNPNDGYKFAGWVKDNTPVNAIPDTITETVTYTATWQQQNPSPDTVNYTINKHFKGNKGNTIKEDKGTATLGTKNATLDSLITRDAVNQIDGENKYVYVSGKTTYTVGTGENKKTENLVATATLTEDTTIDLYYYLDNWKDGSSVKEDNEKGGDGIPDCDQVLIKYVSSNSERGTVSPDMEVLTLRKDNENVQIKINGSKATDNGGRNYFSNWTEDNTQVSTNATLNHQTILDVIKEFTGGKTYTFTANFGYSSGGGSGGSNRPKPPVVDIPDDVPTGLNGKDHYAYIIGYGNNDVRPQNNITRAEVATIFFRLLTDETRTANMTKSNGYNDVKDGDWFCCAVSTLSKMGIIKGYEDGSFKPNDPISRAEFAAIAARFDPDGDKTPATFADVTSHWAKDEISIAANHGWIKGYEDGSFKPDQKITRAETMTLVNRVLNRLPETKDDLHKDMKTWVDNMDETAWYYLAVQEATNSHYFKNKTSTKFEQWTDLRDTRDWSELEK